jgi:hypothetical protein
VFGRDIAARKAAFDGSVSYAAVFACKMEAEDVQKLHSLMLRTTVIGGKDKFREEAGTAAAAAAATAAAAAAAAAATAAAAAAAAAATAAAAAAAADGIR